MGVLVLILWSYSNIVKCPPGMLAFPPTSLGESLPVRNQGVSKKTVGKVAVADASPVLRKLKPYERAWYRNGRPLQPWEIFKKCSL